MKTSIYLFFVSVLGGLMLVLGTTFAQSTHQTDANLVASRTLSNAVSYEGMFSFPVGSSLWIENQEIHFQLPANYLLVLHQTSSSSSPARTRGLHSGIIRCACRKGSGCYPMEAGNLIGCYSEKGTCELCVSSANSSGDPELEAIVFNEAEMLNLEDIAILPPEAKPFEMEEVKPFVFKCPEVVEAVDRYLMAFNASEQFQQLCQQYREEGITERYGIYAFSFSGKVIMATFDSQTARIAMNYADLNDSMGVDRACICRSEHGTCTLKKKHFIPTIYYCVGSCKDCELVDPTKEMPGKPTTAVANL